MVVKYLAIGSPDSNVCAVWRSMLFHCFTAGLHTVGRGTQLNNRPQTFVISTGRGVFLVSLSGKLGETSLCQCEHKRGVDFPIKWNLKSLFVDCELA